MNEEQKATIRFLKGKGNDMKIRRYKERIATDWILDAEMGDWCRYEEVEPLLERIDKLEQLEAKLSKSVDSVKKLRDEWYVRDLTQSDFDTIIKELEQQLEDKDE